MIYIGDVFDSKMVAEGVIHTIRMDPVSIESVRADIAESRDGEGVRNCAMDLGDIKAINYALNIDIPGDHESNQKLRVHLDFSDRIYIAPFPKKYMIDKEKECRHMNSRKWWRVSLL